MWSQLNWYKGIYIGTPYQGKFTEINASENGGRTKKDLKGEKTQNG